MILVSGCARPGDAPPTKTDGRGRVIPFGQDAEWYAREEAARIADNMLLYQRESGGWPKNVDMARALSEAEKGRLRAEKSRADSTLDNGATHTQLRHLAKACTATKRERFKTAFLKGLDYLLAAQQPSGGWPQSYPKAGGYAKLITFNDGAMIGAMTVLRDVAEKKPDYAFVDEARRSQAAEAVQRGVECILNRQIVIDGEPTVWCQQHDPQTFEPRGARSFEPPALCSAESVGIVKFLMQIERPSPEVIAAIQGAVAWFEKVKIVGREQVRKTMPDGRPDSVIVDNPEAPPQWARFYYCGDLGRRWKLAVDEIAINQPIFADRDCKVHDTQAAISRERRTGYSWMGPYANGLLQRSYPAWQAKWAPRKNVLTGSAEIEE